MNKRLDLGAEVNSIEFYYIKNIQGKFRLREIRQFRLPAYKMFRLPAKNEFRHNPVFNIISS